MPDLCVFLATSGHSGVDRVMSNLLPAMVTHGLSVDLLTLENHGPHLKNPPPGLRIIPLGRAHVNTAAPALVKYLRLNRPSALLTDKDRVNRTAILARFLAGVDTRVYVRVGTTVSVNLAGRKAWDRWLQFSSIKYLYPFADGVLVPSQGCADDLQKISGNRIERLRMVPSPIIRDDLPRLALDRESISGKMGGPDPWIIGIGELSRRKDYATFLEAFAHVLKHRPARMVILGEGRQRANLESIAARLGIADRVFLPGFVSNPYAWLNQANVFVHTSRWEGMPVALIEAMALGVPVVSTDCPSGPREVLDGGRLGRLVTVGDAEGVAKGICSCLDQPVEPDVLKQAVAKYRVDKSAQAYIEAMGF